MLISVGVIALNESENLPNLIKNLIEQDYPHKFTEIILVDGGSLDGTKEMMLKFYEEYKDEYYKIIILDNERRIQSCGWNIVLKTFLGDAVIRLDAHALIPIDFISKNVKTLEDGEYVCGGVRTNIIGGKCSFKKKVLLSAERSMFGSGIAKYRNAAKKKYVKTVAHASYRKEVFNKVGYFDECLLRCEDNDLHYRIRRAGYRICLDPQIKSEYITRATIKGMLKQKFLNGKWVGIGSKKSFGMFSLYHFLPVLFFLAVIITIVAIALSFIFKDYMLFLFLPAIVLASLYVPLLLLCAVTETLKNKRLLTFVFLPIIIFFLHTSYGIGTLTGVFTRINNEKK